MACTTASNGVAILLLGQWHDGSLASCALQGVVALKIILSAAMIIRMQGYLAGLRSPELEYLVALPILKRY